MLWITRSDRPSGDVRWLQAAELHVSTFTAPCGHDIGYAILASSFEASDPVAEPSLSPSKT